MKVTKQALESLVELFSELTRLQGLKRELSILASGEVLEAKRSEVLKASQEVIAQRAKTEDLEREISRIAQDLKTVEDRISKDNDRLKTSSSTKDITGIQHELETLAKRKDVLETAELELMEQLESENSALDQLLEHKRRLEELFEADKASNSEKIKLAQAEVLELDNHIGKLRAAADPEVLAIFDQRLLRGVPIGMLRGSSCGACNMSLTSQDVASLNKIPGDELARCPECGAILVRP